jgi:hypothetical protein
MLMDASAELGLGATVFAVLAAWRYHYQRMNITTDEAYHRAHRDATVGEDAEDMGDLRAEGPKEEDVRPPPPEEPAPVHANRHHPFSNQDHVHPPQYPRDVSDSEKKEIVLQQLQQRLETLSDADDGWSSIFAPLPSSESDEKKEKTKSLLTAQIKQIRAMPVAVGQN